MTQAAIHLHIDRLVLDGFAALDARERHCLVAAFERELGRLVALAPDSLSRLGGGDRARLQAPRLLFRHDADATHLGRALAGSLHDALSGVGAAARGR